MILSQKNCYESQAAILVTGRVFLNLTQTFSFYRFQLDFNF